MKKHDENLFDGFQPGEKIRIVSDDKKPLVGGRGPREDDRNPRDRFLVSCNGFMITTLINRKNGIEERENIFYFDINDDKDKTAAGYICLMENFLQDKDTGKYIEKAKVLEFQFDTVRAQKSKEFFGYLLTRPKEIYPKLEEITLVPFCPHHGKTDLDRSFSSTVTSSVNAFENMLKAIQEGIKHNEKCRLTHGEKPIQQKAVRKGLPPKKPEKFIQASFNDFDSAVAGQIILAEK